MKLKNFIPPYLLRPCIIGMFCGFLFGVDSKAQGFSSFDITPITATTNDTVFASFSIEFPTYLSGKNSGFLNMINDTIIYRGCYWNNSSAQMMSYVYDTAKIFNVSPGLYHLFIIASYTLYNTDTTCFQTNTAWNDTIDTTFTVTQFMGLSQVNSKYPFIYPNPANNLLFIETQDLEILEVNIYNTTGSLVTQNQPIVNKHIEIDHLPQGVYVAELKTKQGSIMKRWLKM